MTTWKVESDLKNANDDQYRLRIQKVVNYDNLSRIFKGISKQERSIASEVWLQDEPLGYYIYYVNSTYCRSHR